MCTEDGSDDALSFVSDVSYQSDIADNEPQSINIDLSDGSPLSDTDLTILHFNVNSILADGRIDRLTDICQTVKCDVLLLTESKLSHLIPDNLLLIPGFHEPVRRDRLVNGRHGGGTMVYVSTSHTFIHRPELQLDNFEHLWVDVKVNNKTYAVNALYRPPSETADSHTLFLDSAQTLLSKLNTYNCFNRIIMSDLNFGSCFSILILKKWRQMLVL